LGLLKFGGCQFHNMRIIKIYRFTLAFFNCWLCIAIVINLIIGTGTIYAADCLRATDGTCILNNGWTALANGTADGALEVQADTILDFSSLTSNKAITTQSQSITVNANGHFVSADTGNTELRFLIVNWGLGTEQDVFPDQPTIDRYVTQIKRRGYNMVRFHYLDATLIAYQANNFDYNPQQLDRFFYFISRLKQAGIYVITDLLDSNNGAYGENGIKASCNAQYNNALHFSNECHLLARLYYDISAQTHWKTMVDSLYKKTNPYTGLSLLNDPVLVGIIMTNENSILSQFINDDALSYWIDPAFTRWLKAKYTSNAAIKQAYNDNLSANNFESLNIPLATFLAMTEAQRETIVNVNEIQLYENLSTGTIYFPRQHWQTLSPRMADARMFVLESQNALYQWMTSYLRESGFKGLVADNNNTYSLLNHLSRKDHQWVDMHDYFAHPSDFVNAGSQVNQSSMLGYRATYIQNLAGARVANKPFTVSEHGQVFWNQYRYEASLALPAYAAFQQWDGISQFGQSVELNYLSYPHHRQEAIYPFYVGLDPISRANDTLAALLYVRGDVKPALSKITAEYDANNVLASSLLYSPSNVGKGIAESFSLVTGLAINWKKQPNKNASNSGAAVNAIFPYGQSKTLNVGAQNYTSTGDNDWIAQVKNLRNSSIISSSNITNDFGGIFQTDTGEIILKSEALQLTVNTPYSEGIAFESLSQATPINRLTILSANTSGMVSLSAMDKDSAGNIKPLNLNVSNRMLIVLATDAQNTGMTFYDPIGQTLASLGTQPVLIKPNKVVLKLSNANSTDLTVYAVDYKGIKRQLIPVTRLGCNAANVDCTSIQFKLDISTLSNGATTFFEVTNTQLYPLTSSNAQLLSKSSLALAKTSPILATSQTLKSQTATQIQTNPSTNAIQANQNTMQNNIYDTIDNSQDTAHALPSLIKSTEFSSKNIHATLNLNNDLPKNAEQFLMVVLTGLDDAEVGSVKVEIEDTVKNVLITDTLKSINNATYASPLLSNLPASKYALCAKVYGFDGQLITSSNQVNLTIP
jgi:hypothetical protein